MLDEKFRLFVLLAPGGEGAASDVRDAALRGWRRPEAKGFRTALVNSMVRATLNGEETMAFEVSRVEMDRFAEKILRGLYFHHYAEVFSGEISSACTHINSDEIDMKAVISAFSKFRSGLTKGSVKNPHVFRYEYGRLVVGEVPAFAIICTFYDNVTIFGLGKHK